MCSEAGITMAPAKTCGTLNLDMQTGHMPTRTLSEEEMVTELSARVDAAARRYRGAIMRYLLRPPLSLTLKYAAFMMDLAQQTDHMQEVLARAAERASERSKDSQKGEPSGEFRIDRSGEVSLEVVYAATVNLSPGARLATLLRVYQREERSRMQHALSDLRRLGYAQEAVDYYLRFLQLEPKPDPTIKVDLDTFIATYQAEQEPKGIQSDRAEPEPPPIKWPTPVSVLRLKTQPCLPV